MPSFTWLIHFTTRRGICETSYKPIFAPDSGDGLRVFNYLYGSVSKYKEHNDTANVMDQSLNMRFNTAGIEDERLCCYGSQDAN